MNLLENDVAIIALLTLLLFSLGRLQESGQGSSAEQPGAGITTSAQTAR